MPEGDRRAKYPPRSGRRAPREKRALRPGGSPPRARARRQAQSSRGEERSCRDFSASRATQRLQESARLGQVPSIKSRGRAGDEALELLPGRADFPTAPLGNRQVVERAVLRGVQIEGL